MSSPRIAVDLRVLDRPGLERTGIGRYAIESFRALRRARPDWEFIVHSNRPDLLRAGDRVEVRTSRLPTHLAAGRIAWLHLSAASPRGDRPDLWFGPTFVTPPRWRGPAVVTVHDLVFDSRPELYRGRAAATYVSRAVRRSAEAAQRIICPSPAIARMIVETLDVDPGAVLALPWGVGPEFQAQASEPGGDYVLFVGRDTERKGLGLLSEALRAAGEQGSPIRLVLTHSPRDEHRAALEAKTEFEVVSAPGDAELARLYAGAMALVYPSRIEGFGFPVAEAMACGCPVIASDLPEIREWAQDVPRYFAPGDAGALAEALVELSSDAELRDRMGARGRELSAGRTWEAFGELAATAIESVLAGAQPGRESTNSR